MNLRIDSNSLRFKITEQELYSLLELDSLQEKILMANKFFLITIMPLSEDNVFEVVQLVKPEGSELLLKIPLNKLQELKSLGRSRDGLKFNQDSIEVYLQVDVKSDSRHREGV